MLMTNSERELKELLNKVVMKNEKKGLTVIYKKMECMVSK